MGRLFVTLILGLTGLLFWGAALAAWRRREAPAADLFAAVASTAGFGAVAVAISLALDLPRAVTFVFTFLISLLLPIPWLLFSFEYTGRNELVSLRVAGVAALLPGVGLLATGLIFGSQLLPWLQLPSRETASGLAAALVALLSMVQWLALLYAGGLLLAGSAVVLWTFHRYEHLNSVTGMMLGIFGTLPWLSLLFGYQVANINPLALPWTVAVGFLAGGVAAGCSLGRYDLFQNVPAAGNVGPKTVIEELEDIVIVTDREGTVVEVNAAAKRALDTTPAEVVSANIRVLLDEPLADISETDTIEFRLDNGRKLFEPNVSELTDQHGHCLGYAVVLRDVTARTTRQQRLEVLNRVLRHNLRNDVSVILGHAELLREKAGDPSLVDDAEAIVRASQSLTRLSEEAREVEQIMAATETLSQDVSLASIAETMTDAAAADRQGVTYDCDMPIDVVVEETGDLLQLALRNLVENAIEHNDSEEPYVSLRGSYDPNRPYPLHLSVVDNGPGIPDHERRAIEQGVETPLEHGSGLGLWVVRWAIIRLGGEIDFERREPRGTAVVLRLPRAHRSEAGTQPAPADVRK